MYCPRRRRFMILTERGVNLQPERYYIEDELGTVLMLNVGFFT